VVCIGALLDLGITINCDSALPVCHLVEVSSVAIDFSMGESSSLLEGCLIAPIDLLMVD
jgi:hypothetical protein